MAFVEFSAYFTFTHFCTHLFNSLILSTAGHGATDLCVCQLRLKLSLTPPPFSRKPRFDDGYLFKSYLADKVIFKYLILYIYLKYLHTPGSGG